jgi:hypothetical protein
MENKKMCILLSHVHVYDNESYKHQIMEFAIDYFRKNNKNSYIILTGHGLKPKDSILNKYDHYIWTDYVDETEIGKGHPKDVSAGINHAIDSGFEYIFKCRADSIIMIPEIEQKCLEIINAESKQMLVSYGTCSTDYWLGDLVLFSELKFLRKIWDDSKWDYSTNGLENFGKGLDREFKNKYINWMDLIKSTVSYRDPINLKWVDLLGPHPHKSDKWNTLKEIIEEDDFDFKPFVWGNDWEHTPSSYLNEGIFYGK